MSDDLDRIEYSDIDSEYEEKDILLDYEESEDIDGLSEQELIDAITDYSAEDDNLDSLYGENPGDYLYRETEFGKEALGQLELNPGVRNSYNQRTVGGNDRLDSDDGGHIIGNRFGGSSDYENLFPQDRGVNRGGYKALENEFANHLANGDKVYVDIATYDRNGSERPNDIMVNYQIEDKNNERQSYHESLMNVSAKEQEEWEKIAEEYDE